MSFGVSDTHSRLADPIWKLPLVFGYSVSTLTPVCWVWFREDAPPWRYGRGVGVRFRGKTWFVGWSNRILPADETDGSIRMMGGRELLNDGRDIGAWGQQHE